MKSLAATLLATLVPSILAAPALLWKNGKDASSPVKHSSKPVEASKIIEKAVQSSPDAALASVIFLVGRDTANGDEALSKLTTSGSLPNVASMYESAHTVHHHVNGLESRHTVTRDARKALSATGKNNNVVLDVSLDEFNLKMSNLDRNRKLETEAAVSPEGAVYHSKGELKARKHSKALETARVLIVNVAHDGDHSALDNAVSNAVESNDIGSVVLAGIRSTDEVNRERSIYTKRMASASRRLENAADDDANDSGKANYFVNMTPNIFSGILFFLFFAYVAYLGLTCMNMIEGQDVYVSKMPSVGREA